jgi:hypothetical protein
MNCRTCHYELSQCLDARLPSGRRAIVMQHVEACAKCAKFWDELQQAQKLVLQLPRHRTGGDFRAQLFARIEAGEGTPPAVFQEPVPMMTKFRYALTGAAAAAAVLAAMTFARSDAPKTDISPSIASASAVDTQRNPRALVARDHSAEARQATPITDADFASLAPALPPVRELTPDLVALEAAREFQNRFVWTVSNADRLQQGNDEAAVRMAWENTRAMQEMGKLLLALQHDRQVTFADQELQRELNALVTSLDQIQQPNPEAMRAFVPTVRSVQRLSDIVGQIHVRVGDPVQQQWALQRMTVSFPAALDRLFESIPETTALDLDARHVRMLQTNCGPKLVILRQRK